jgi:hypothetical protein
LFQLCACFSTVSLASTLISLLCFVHNHWVSGYTFLDLSPFNDTMSLSWETRVKYMVLSVKSAAWSSLW